MSGAIENLSVDPHRGCVDRCRRPKYLKDELAEIDY
jgi:hypothetical protein